MKHNRLKHNTFRRLVFTIVRSGGAIGEVEVMYSVYYYAPGVNDVKSALPGILSENGGKINFKQDEGNAIGIFTFG